MLLLLELNHDLNSINQVQRIVEIPYRVLFVIILALQEQKGPRKMVRGEMSVNEHAATFNA